MLTSAPSMLNPNRRIRFPTPTSSKALLGVVAISLVSCFSHPPLTLAQGTGEATPGHEIAPPQALLKWDHSVEGITLGVQATKEEAVKTLDAIGSLKPEDCTFESVFLAIDQLHAIDEEKTASLLFYREISPSKEIRDASIEAVTLFEEFKIEVNMRVDVFNAMVAAEKKIKTSGQWEELLPEQKRLVDQAILEGKRLGLTLPDEKQAELRRVRGGIEEAHIAFQRNLGEDTQVITFTEDDLKGVTREVLSTYKKRKADDGVEVYDITFRPPDRLAIMENADNPRTRQKFLEAWELSQPDNVKLLEKCVELKRQYASLLGYKSWEDYITETRMVKSAQNVEEFLSDLEHKLHPLGIKERDTLLKMKQQDYEVQGLEYDGTFNKWDYSYYDRKYKETSLELNHTLVKEYFPVSTVIPTIFDIYSSLFDIEIKEVKGSTTWHSDVQTFAVWEKDAETENDFLGYFYLDIFPRDGKYSHAAAFPLLRGYEKADGCRQYPVAAMVANFARASAENPALIPHSDVVTFFHEMGHVFHHTLMRNKLWQFSSIDGPIIMDFVEAPSQMLENWIWEPMILEKISSHYETHKPLPADLIDKIVQSRYINIGLFDLQQIFQAEFDLQIHTGSGRIRRDSVRAERCRVQVQQEAQDYTKLFNDLHKDIALRSGGADTTGQSVFPHLLSNYAGAYYGYLYSLVFAADMYATVFKADPLSAVSGRCYREKVLSVGGSRDPSDILKDFLGREPNNQAFFEQFAVSESEN